MKIDKVVMSCDDNSKYLNLWPYVSKVCKMTLNITPVLFHITDTYSDFICDEYGIVKKVKRHPELPTNFQAQIYRLYATKFLENQNCLISDIDMLIFNREYFINQVSEFDDKDFIVYLSDAYDLSRPEVADMYALNRVPMCYLLGNSETYKKLLQINCDFNEFAEKIYNFNYGYYLPDFHKDEVFVGKMIYRNHNNINIVNLKRGIQNVWKINGRIEKNMFYDETIDFSDTNNLIDCHIPGDYDSNIDKLNNVINNILTYF
jgi:hypothetical protein